MIKKIISQLILKKIKPYLVDILDSKTEKNIEKISQLFLQEAKSKQRTNLTLVATCYTILKKSITARIRRIEVVIHFQVAIKKKDSNIHEDIQILYYAAADNIGEKVSGYLIYVVLNSNQKIYFETIMSTYNISFQIMTA